MSICLTTGAEKVYFAFGQAEYRATPRLSKSKKISLLLKICKSRALSPYLVFSYISLFILGLCDNVRGPVFPELLNYFKLNDFNGSLFFAVSSGMGIFGSIGVRKLLQHYHDYMCLAVSTVFLFLGMFIISISNTYLVLMIGSLFVGTSIGMLGVVQNLMVLTSVSADKISKAQSGLHSMYGLASLFSPLLVNICLGFFQNWRSVFLLTSITCLLFGVCVVWKRKEFTRSVHKKSDEVKIFVPGAETKKSIIFGFMIATYVLAEILVSTRITLYLTRVYEFEIEHANYYTSAFFVLLLAGRVVFTFWHAPWTRKQLLIASLVGSLLCLSLGLLGHPLFLVLTGLTMSVFYPISMASLSIIFKRYVQTATSWAIALSSVCVITMHASVGYMTQRFGIATAFWLGPAVLVVCLVLLIYFAKNFKEHQLDW